MKILKSLSAKVTISSLWLKFWFYGLNENIFFCNLLQIGQSINEKHGVGYYLFFSTKRHLDDFLTILRS